MANSKNKKTNKKSPKSKKKSSNSTKKNKSNKTVKNINKNEKKVEEKKVNNTPEETKDIDNKKRTIKKIKHFEEKPIEENSKQENIKEEKDKENDKVIITEEKTINEQKDNAKQEEVNNKKKIKIYLIICIVAIVIVISLLSTVFALLNRNNNTLTKGTNIKEIDISNLTIEEAKERISEALEIELKTELNLNYNENESIGLKPEEIEFKYKIDEAIEHAYATGRSGNLIIDNYKLLYTILFGNKIDIDYTYNEDILDNFIDDINFKLDGAVIQPTYYIEEDNLIINKGTDGIEIDKNELKDKIIKEIFNRNYKEIKDNQYNKQIEIPIVYSKANSIDIKKIYSEIYTEPQNAYFETDPYKIYVDRNGIDLDIPIEEAENIINQEEKDEYIFKLKITRAEITIDDLGLEAFPYLISSFSTRYNAGDINRTNNLKIAAQKINGKVLMPGEEFSYNKIVGKRTVEEGYKDAKIYQDGGVVDGLAGGICQISSTLYNAVVLANLQVTERRNHSYTTSYVSAGRDATVVYGAIDFKFVNSRSYPIKLEASVNNGIAEFKIHGIQEEKEYQINILPVVTQSIPYATQYIEDATLPPGQQAVVQAGHAGYKVTTYKEVKLDGNVISKDIISTDTYNPMRAIIRIGP